VNEIWTSVVGNVATQPKTALTKNGHVVASFRLASSVRRFDKVTRDWVDDDPSYITVVCWRRLAENVTASVSKGQPVVVHGRLKIKEWERDGRKGTSAEIEASAVGHDLSLGTSAWEKHQPRTPLEVTGPDHVADDLAYEVSLETVDLDTGEIHETVAA
jgi:single-strand DNA-binding protein